ncbi:MAG TPA: histidine kinase [Clostridia bacterium]|nr:histidine kinase [Clostridia bacterium]
MDKLLTKQNLADRWQVTIGTIDRWVNDGVISPVRGIPSVRFNQEHILELEGTETGKLSPLERKRLLAELKQLETKKEELERENEELRNYVRLVFGEGIKFLKDYKEKGVI